MGLSGLNAQRFTYNLIDSPICPNCHNGNETAIHYLWDCETYQLERKHMIDRIKAETSADQITKSNILQIAINGEIDKKYHTTLFIITSEFLLSTARFK
jgi:hypothetical protein